MNEKNEKNEMNERNFTYHAPKVEDVEKYNKIREKAKELAYLLDEVCPNSR